VAFVRYTIVRHNNIIYKYVFIAPEIIKVLCKSCNIFQSFVSMICYELTNQQRVVWSRDLKLAN